MTSSRKASGIERLDIMTRAELQEGWVELTINTGAALRGHISRVGQRVSGTGGVRR